MNQDSSYRAPLPHDLCRNPTPLHFATYVKMFLQDCNLLAIHLEGRCARVCFPRCYPFAFAAALWSWSRAAFCRRRFSWQIIRCVCVWRTTWIQTSLVPLACGKESGRLCHTIAKTNKAKHTCTALSYRIVHMVLVQHRPSTEFCHL